MSAAALDERAITVRRPDFGSLAGTPRYWYGGEPFATHFLNALSSVFPDGEAFFVRSVMHYRGEIQDPALREAIRHFAAQEGHHSHEHADHVQMLLDQGYPWIGRLNEFAARGLTAIQKRFPRYSLAQTAALEHLTAILARQLLENPGTFSARMDVRMAPLWEWHALEEAEHKAVAFDVLRSVGISEWARGLALVQATFGLFFETLLRTSYMLQRDGRLFDFSVWRNGFRFLFGKSGFLRGMRKEYMAWFRRDFHPNDIDDQPLIDAWRDRVAPQAS